MSALIIRDVLEDGTHIIRMRIPEEAEVIIDLSSMSKDDLRNNIALLEKCIEEKRNPSVQICILHAYKCELEER